MNIDVTNKKKEVLILYNNLFHYRIPIFKILSEKYNLTVAYSIGNKPIDNLDFKIILLPLIKLNRLVIHKVNIFSLCQNFDVVIAYGDIAWLSYSTLPFYKNRKFKIIFWSIGVSASYDKTFDSIKRWDYIRDIFYKKADALIFYTDYPINKYINRGYSKEKLFVAPNTVEVSNNNVSKVEKDSILFIGTLYMQKGLLALLENYKEAYLENKLVPKLNIVGGGSEFIKLQKWIIKNDLLHKIIPLGPIFDIQEKANIFKKSFACLSPNQAGLSVLESFGYGVPFITSKNAITGGERLNIKDGDNGILMDDSSQLSLYILDITSNPNKYIKMGENAKNYYEQYRKPQDMANGLIKAIQYVQLS